MYWSEYVNLYLPSIIEVEIYMNFFRNALPSWHSTKNSAQKMKFSIKYFLISCAVKDIQILLVKTSLCYNEKKVQQLGEPMFKEIRYANVFLTLCFWRYVNHLIWCQLVQKQNKSYLEEWNTKVCKKTGILVFREWSWNVETHI